MFEVFLIRIDQLYSAVIFFLSWIISWFYPKQDSLWLVAERKAEARDNGYWMFRYIVENHPEINVRYIIKKDSPDYQKLLPWKDKIVEASSFTHYMLMWKARYGISTHYHHYFPYRVNHQLFVNCLKKINKKCRLVWLQHGIIKDNLQGLYNNALNFDLFITGAKPEYDYISINFGYPSGVVQYTGLARFDQLHGIKVKKNQILVMPTWRLWLTKKNFPESDYYVTYSKLLQNDNLHRVLEKYDAHLIFYPHSSCQHFISLFAELKLPNRVVIADSEHYDVQQLLKESALLITDYSSVFWDFAYMKKPHVYFQFDEKAFREGHFPQGYYDYHNGLGDWTSDIDELIAIIDRYAQKEMSPLPKFLEQHSVYFPLCDKCNCERIYNEIIKLS